MRILLLSILIAGATALAQAPKAGDPAPGTLIDIGGHKLHLRCVGPEEAKPVVIFEAGGGGYSRDWTTVQNQLSPRIRSCAYDRAGSGWSDKGPAPRTMKQEVFELHNLLQAAKIKGPYVLVGQSIGGLLVRFYVEQYSRDVAGVVLVDATHESNILFNTRINKWVELRTLATGRPVPEPKREGAPSTEYKPEDDYLAEEFQLLYQARQTHPSPFGDRPLIVLAAGIRPPPPGMSEEDYKDLRARKNEQAKDLAGLSKNAKFVLDASSRHNMQADNPALVARSVEEVLAAVANGTRF